MNVQNHLALLAVAALSTMVTLTPSWASDRWEEAAGGAVAILPVPLKAEAITGGSLYCAEQRWALRLRAERPDPAAPLSDAGLIVVDGAKFPVKAAQTATDITMPVPVEAVEALKNANRLAVSVGAGAETGKVSAIFALRGSGAVIAAIAPRCSQVDMSAFTAVSLSPEDASVAGAQNLLADEIKLVRQFAGKAPTVTAALLKLDGDKQLLFASLCSESSYYGASGCTLSGFAAESASATWREVYSTEGMRLHTDPANANGGWPNLVTLPLANGLEPIHWTWNGAAYQLRDQPVTEADDPSEQGDSTE